MCGRFALWSTIQAIQEEFNIRDIPKNFHNSYNIAPSQSILSIIKESPPKFQLLRWGLIPFWAKEEKIGYKMINARAETLAEKPSYRTSFKKKRCLIVADGFYEWKKSKEGKVPHYITLKNKKPFTFAGLYDECKINNKIIKSCTIVTTEPNKLLKLIHNRMPVIIKKKDRNTWLNNEEFNQKKLQSLLKAYPEKDMQEIKVSTLVNSPRNNTKDIIKPFKESQKKLIL